MKPRAQFSQILLLAGMLLGVASCRTASPKRPVLHFAFSPQAEQVPADFRTDTLANYLQKQLDRPVEVVRIEGYRATIEAMRSGKVDVASFGPLAYLIAAQQAGAEAIVSRGNTDGSLGGYYANIAVPRESKLRTVEDIKQHAGELTFGFSDPASASGNLYPRAELLTLGIVPERDFKHVVFAGSHLGSLVSIRDAKVDAGAFEASFIDRLVATGKMEPDDIHIVWRSELIPSGPTAVRSALPAEEKKAIADALMNIQVRDPELWQQINSSYKGQPGKTVAVSDANYNQLRQYVRQVKDFKMPTE